MVEGPYGVKISLCSEVKDADIFRDPQDRVKFRRLYSRPPDEWTLRKLAKTGYEGTPPATDEACLELTFVREWQQEPISDFQIELLYRMNEDGLDRDQIREQWPDRWLAGCQIKELLTITSDFTWFLE